MNSSRVNIIQRKQVVKRDSIIKILSCEKIQETKERIPEIKINADFQYIIQMRNLGNHKPDTKALVTQDFNY